MPAQLLALTDGPSILLDKPIVLLGRHPECDIQLNSRKVSRRHCCIAQVHDYLVVRDLGSTNGIRINGASVLEGRLKAGDELTIGNFKYQICWDLLGGAVPAPRSSVVVPRLPPAAPKKQVHDVLEDAEEPVELDEDVAVSRILTAKPAVPRPISNRPASAGTINEELPSSILPDSLNLIPPSSLQNRPAG